MSGVEPIAIVSLIDACIGITKTIIDIGRAVRNAQGLPPKLQEVFRQLPVIDDLLETAKEKYKAGQVTSDHSTSVLPVLEECETALRGVREIFNKACPRDPDDRGKRIWKGIKTVFLGKSSKLKEFLETIQSGLRLIEQKEVFTIGDRLEELQQITEDLASDNSGKYSHTGAGNIIANESGSPVNYIQGGEGNRQVFNPGVYHEGTASK